MSKEVNSQSGVVASNMIWRLLERFGAQGVTFIVSLVLARLLEPKVYGVVAIVNVIVTILQVFVDSGFANALIQKKDADNLDFSSVFYFNIAFCTIIYAGLFFAAPLLEAFYKMEQLTEMIRVVGLLLFISGFKNVQQAYVSKHMMFKKFFYATLGGTIGAAVVGIIMALNGYGVWALIFQMLFNNFIDTIILWVMVKWRPVFAFSFQRLKSLFSYGWKLLATSLITTVYNEIRQLIIGKMYTSEDLAFYNRGNQLPYYIVTNINSTIDSVLLPAMSNVQDNKERVKQMTRRSIKISGFLLWPLMLGFAACSKQIITLVLTEKWLPCLPYILIFCISYGLYPITTANLNVIKAMGRSDVLLILEIIKKSVGILAIIVSMWFGVFWIAVSGLFVTVFSQIVNAWPNKKWLGYSYFDQLKDILPSLALSVFMGGCVYSVSLLGLSDAIMLLIQVPLGAVIYIFGAKMFGLEAYSYVLNVVKGLIKKKKG